MHLKRWPTKTIACCSTWQQSMLWQIEYLINQIKSVNPVNFQLRHIYGRLIKNESNLKEQQDKEIQKINSHKKTLRKRDMNNFLTYWMTNILNTITWNYFLFDFFYFSLINYMNGFLKKKLSFIQKKHNIQNF